MRRQAWALVLVSFCGAQFVGDARAEGIDAIAKRLRSTEWTERRDAAWQLAELGPQAESAAEALGRMLTDEVEECRKAAAIALVALGPGAAEAADDLVAALVGPLRPLAIDALHNMGCAAYQPLLRRSENSISAGEALIALGIERPFPEHMRERLIELIQGSDARERIAAAKAWSSLCHEYDQSLAPPAAEHVDALIRLVTGNDVSGGEAAVMLLAELGPAAVRAAPEVLQAPQRWKLDSLGSGDFRADDEGRLVANLVYALCKFGPDAGPVLQVALTDDDRVVRTIAAMAMAHIDPSAEHVLSVLIDSLHHPCGGWCVFSHVRRMDVEALAACGLAAVPALLEVATKEPIRRDALEAISLMSADAAAVAGTLVEAVGSDRMEIRAVAAEALGAQTFQDQETVPALRNALHDEAEPVRLAAERSLAKVYVHRIEVDDDMALLAELNSIDYLSLDEKAITDAGLKHLRGLTIKELALPESITDAGIAHLKNVHGIESLYLSDTQITDASLEVVAGMSELESLYLGNVRGITDSGLAHLVGLVKLKSITLYDTEITDAGIDRLHALRHLEYVNFRGSDATDDGVVRLREALPKCKVYGP